MTRVLMSCLVLLLAVGSAAAEGGITDTYSLWLGGHYSDFSDYDKKVGEFDRGNTEWFPEFKINYLSEFENGYLDFRGHVYDSKNINAATDITISNRFRARFQYRSLIHQFPQDLLANLEAREYLPVTSSPGGKTLTHEILDPEADYNVHRQEILSEFQALLSAKGNLRLVGAHRTVMTTGEDQSVSSNHCFSCHQTSQTARIDKRHHQLEVGLDGTFKKFDVGFRTAYRYFESVGPDVLAYFDPAKHPVNGGSGAEFGSRVNFSDTLLPVNDLPKIEKFSHKLRLSGDIGPGQFTGKLGYARTDNRTSGIDSKAYSGAARWSVVLNGKSRLITKLSGYNVRTEDPYVSVPVYRRGRPTGYVDDFSFWRLSSLDRNVGEGSAEFIRRLSEKAVLSVTGGLKIVDRYDYPVLEDGTTSTHIYAQAKLNWRKGMDYRANLKYRIELINDPFVSGRGLFELVGQTALDRTIADGSNQVLYPAREFIRYQDITSAPNQIHEVDWESTWRPMDKVTVTVGTKFRYDKNDDLDSIDVEHTAYRPNLNVVVTPDMHWMLTLGYTFDYSTSRLPAAVALFDG